MANKFVNMHHLNKLDTSLSKLSVYVHKYTCPNVWIFLELFIASEEGHLVRSTV